ncbi:MAG: oligosaccharide flippase family protein, partial [Deltaproteobacteria bacterium]
MINDKIESLLKHEGVKRYSANTAWLLLEKVARAFVWIFVWAWVARYLGPGQFGVFSYAQSIVIIFIVFASLGLDGIVVRELVKDESRRDVLLGSAFVLKFFGAIVMFIVLAISLLFATNDTLIIALVL